MVFSSHIFLFYFLPLALGVYYLLPRRAKHLGLTLLSYAFYGWSNPIFVLLMFLSTLIDYICGLIIAKQWGKSGSGPIEALIKGGERSRKQRLAVTVSICSNLSLLAIFKYFNFTVESYNGILAFVGLDAFQLEGLLRIVLPLGISFYTFQSMSYSIDVYRGDAKVIRNFTNFACFVSMFPQLVAGPIIRFQDVAEQLEHRDHTLEKWARGIAFLSLGLGKKLLLANPCGKIADMAFGSAALGVFDAWYGVTGYAFQIYFDFSAYSDMAIGLGLMLGFVFPKNFDSPYHSKSITEFWQRWHLSLSHWLRDYLYIPLGGNRGSEWHTYKNLAIVMLLGGLWHGASWNFVIWGGIHGSVLSVERMQGKDSFYRRMPGPIKVLMTFVLTLFTWVFFRAETLGGAVRYCGSMLGLVRPSATAELIDGLIYKPYYVLSFFVAGAIIFGAPQVWDFTRKITWPKVVWVTVVLFISIAAMTTQAYNPFIYFIF